MKSTVRLILIVHKTFKLHCATFRIARVAEVNANHRSFIYRIDDWI